VIWGLFRSILTHTRFPTATAPGRHLIRPVRIYACA
jgi:glutamate synthase domain-containing protein 1